MHIFETILDSVDKTLDSVRKRHIAGGVLLSVSMLFGGLAFTVITIKNEEDLNDKL